MTSTTEVEDTDVNSDATSLDEPVAASNNIPTNGGKEVKIKYINSKSRKIKNRQLTNKITMMFLVIMYSVELNELKEEVSQAKPKRQRQCKLYTV